MDDKISNTWEFSKSAFQGLFPGAVGGQNQNTLAPDATIFHVYLILYALLFSFINLA